MKPTPSGTRLAHAPRGPAGQPPCGPWLAIARRARRSAAAGVVGLGATVGLTGCLGDGDALRVDAQADTLALAGGQSADLLANDTVAGVTASAGAGGNVSFTVDGGPLPAGLQAAEGRVSAAEGLAPGTYRFSYTVCDIADAGNCATAEAHVTVLAPAITAGADVLTLAVGAVGDVLANDTLDGRAASADRVSVSVDSALPAGIQLGAAGLVGVGGAALPGTYTIGYRVCQIGVPANCAASTASITVPASGTLAGRVLDASDGSPVAGASVALEGGAAAAVTDAGGNFSLGAVTPGRRSVVLSAPGFAPTVRVADVALGTDIAVQARLLPAGTGLAVDPVAGGTASLAGTPAQLVLPASSLLRADGSTATAPARVVLTPVSPAADSSLLPGDYTADLASQVVPIESFGALSVQLVDADGAPLRLAEGVRALLRVPVGSRSASLPASALLLYFDVLSGRWLQDGTAQLAGSGAARYYEGAIARAGVWSVDAAYDAVRISGCVADRNGVRIAGARIAADGVDYSGTSTAITDAQGAFVLPVRRAAQAVVSASAGGRTSNTLGVGPVGADAGLPSCLVLDQAGAGVTVKLTWGAAPSDLDAHLFLPDGSEVSYIARGRLDAAPFANLDVDDVSSFGPEVVTISRLMVGTYRYAVDNYSGQASGRIGASGARVELNLPNRSTELLVPPTSGESSSTDWWHAFELDVAPDCTITLRRTGSFSTSPPGGAAIRAPVYCSAP